MKNSIAQQHWVMDYETIKNLFVGVFISVTTDEEYTFIIHKSKNDLKIFLDFLKRNVVLKERHISFNGLMFDSQISQYIIKNRDHLLSLDGDTVARLIYAYSQQTINAKYPEYREYQLSILQTDVYKINHWDSMARHCSLKWAQCMIDWPVVLDMPVEHYHEVHDAETISKVVYYCKNDVRSTKELLFISKVPIGLRNKIRHRYNLKCDNYSNTKMGSELLLKLYCENTGKDPWEVRNSRTHRPSILLKDVIFHFIKLKTKTFQDLYYKLYNLEVFKLKDSFKEVVEYKGAEIHYGLGGIHQSKRGIFKSDDEYVIYDIDVMGEYPNTAIQNHMYPAHLGPEFYTVYKEDIVDVRNKEKQKPSKERDVAIIEGFKEAANASYGKSNSLSSWLYDPSYTLQTTVNCQLQLTMLIEDVVESIGATLIQANTDGITLRIKRKDEKTFLDLCKTWETITKLSLEYVTYSAMYTWDVEIGAPI